MRRGIMLSLVGLMGVGLLISVSASSALSMMGGGMGGGHMSGGGYHSSSMNQQHNQHYRSMHAGSDRNTHAPYHEQNSQGQASGHFHDQSHYGNQNHYGHETNSRDNSRGNTHQGYDRNSGNY